MLLLCLIAPTLRPFSVALLAEQIFVDVTLSNYCTRSTQRFFLPWPAFSNSACYNISIKHLTMEFYYPLFLPPRRRRPLLFFPTGPRSHPGAVFRTPPTAHRLSCTLVNSVFLSRSCDFTLSTSLSLSTSPL